MRCALWIVLFVVLTGAMLVAAQCGAAELAPYPIGVNLELTGRVSSLGIPVKRGFEIASDAVNAAGGVNGRKLKAVYYDNESDPAKAVILTKRLIDVDNVIACTGYALSGNAMAAVQTVESGNTIMIAGTATDKLWIPTKKWVFNIVPRQREASIPVLLDTLLQRGSKKIAYIYIDTTYGQTGRETFDVVAKEMKVSPAIIEKYAAGSTDVGPQITHIKASGADGILMSGNVADSVMVIKNARDQGFTGPIVCDYAIVGPEFIELGGKYVEGIVTTSLKALIAPELPANDPQKKIAMDLYSKYTQQYGTFSLYSGHSWDMVYLIAEALKKVDPNLDPSKKSDVPKIREQLRDNLEKVKGFVGQNGTFNFAADNHNGLGPKCYVPVAVQNGKWTLYKTK
ncbi:MAG TPA: ABC transporter substrate-binding protein [Syntrophorhabdales bacterium]|nr:ABC transporter substrate-binding protein [Syntrophorhabdales bacterium]